MSNESNYVEGRLSEQVKWYETKANENKLRFHVFQTIIIIASVVIPIVNLINFAPLEIRIISSILGGTVAGVTAFIQLKSTKRIGYCIERQKKILRKKNIYFYMVLGHILMQMMIIERKFLSKE